MRIRFWPALGAAMLALPACVDQSPVAPEVITPVELSPDVSLLECFADVVAAEIRCDPQSPDRPAGLRADLLVGGQDRYVRLASSDTRYDEISREFLSTVTVQNLTRNSMGTDGVSSPGVRVFFHSGPDVVSGTGAVEVLNSDGTDTFTETQQPYFLYPGVLEPLQISSGREWVFLLDPGVLSFSFTVYISTPIIEETAPLLGPVWSGGESTDWSAASNWEGGRLPAPDSSVTIPSDSLLSGGAHPVLAGDASVNNLRVGAGSSLNLAGFRLLVGGNLDVTGSISDGTVVLSNESALVGGEVPALEILGGARLQRPTVARSPVTVSGSLVVGENPLVISIPAPAGM